MYINWYFDYFPKIFNILSFVFNPIFIYLNLSDATQTLGKYRYFLLTFSTFNILYSFIEAIIPVATYGSHYVLLIFLPAGPFSEYLTFGQFAVSFRCGFISLSYAILSIHFFYRYFALFNPQFNEKLTSKSGIIFLFLFFISHGIVWTTVCEMLMFSTDDARETARTEFLTRFDQNISEVPFINIVYRSSNISTIKRCWLGIYILVTISVVSITLYFVIGSKILAKLQTTKTISKKSRKIHRLLLRTLVIQTIIPTVVSFLPCMIVWFLPYFGYLIGNYGNIGMVSLSAFPCLDALAMIALLPNYQNRFLVSNAEPSSVKNVSQFDF